MTESLVSFTRWVIESLGVLVPFAQSAGVVLAPLVIAAVPGLAVYGTVRLVSRGTERLFGWTDSLLTVFIFSVAIGLLFGGLFAESWGSGHGAPAVVGILLVGVSAGLFFGSLRTLGRQPAAYLALFMVGTAFGTGAFLLG